MKWYINKSIAVIDMKVEIEVFVFVFLFQNWTLEEKRAFIVL